MTHPLRLLLVAPFKTVHSPALEYAGVLAQALGASLRMVAFVHAEAVDIFGLINIAGRDKAREGLMDLYRNWLNTETVLLREKGLDVSYDVVWIRQTAADLVAYAEKAQADMVIKDLHEESTLKQLVLSSVDWHLLGAHAPSVLYVKEALDHEPRKFLAAVDLDVEGEAGNANNNQIISTALNLAKACHASLHLVTVYNGGVLCGAGFTEAYLGREHPSYEERKEVFDALASQHGITREHRHLMVGTPANAIRAYVERCGYDLLLIGTANHPNPESDIGSTAQGILANPACSVLVIKTLPTGNSAHVGLLGSETAVSLQLHVNPISSEQKAL
jgi:universal stress protein E